MARSDWAWRPCFCSYQSVANPIEVLFSGFSCSGLNGDKYASLSQQPSHPCRMTCISILWWTFSLGATWCQCLSRKMCSGQFCRASCRWLKSGRFVLGYLCSEDATRFYMAETALAINSIHEMGYIHRFARRVRSCCLPVVFDANLISAAVTSSPITCFLMRVGISSWLI